MGLANLQGTKGLDPPKHVQYIHVWLDDLHLKIKNLVHLDEVKRNGFSKTLKNPNRMIPYLVPWWYYPGQKNWDKRAHMAQVRDLSSMHAPMFGLCACLNFFGQGSSFVHFKVVAAQKRVWNKTCHKDGKSSPTFHNRFHLGHLSRT